MSETEMKEAIAVEVKWFEANKTHALTLSGVFLMIGLLVGFILGLIA